MSRFTARSLVGGTIGLSAGVLMALPLFAGAKVSEFYGFVNAPAGRLAQAWTAAGLPPSGEIAWLVVPAAMIVLRWGVVGVIVGAITGLSFRRKSE